MGIDIALNLYAFDRSASGIQSVINGFGGLNSIINRLGSTSKTSSDDLGGVIDKAGLFSSALLGVGIEVGIFSAAVADAINNASGLQDATVRLGIASNATAEQQKGMSAAIQSAAQTSIFSETDISDGMQRLIERTIPLPDAMGKTGAAMVNLAEAINSKTIPAADLIGTYMSTYGLKAKDAAHAADVLTTSFYNGVPSVTELQSAIRTLGAKSETLNVSGESTMTMLDLLSQRMGNGAVAATSLAYFMKTVADPTQGASKQFEDMGIITVNKSTPAIWNLRAALEASGGTAAKVAEAYDGSAGSLKHMFDAGQKIPGLNLGQNFMLWADKTKSMSDAMYDSQGHFVGMKRAVEILQGSLKANFGDDAESKTQALANIFNVRSGTAASVLTNMEDFSQQYQDVFDKMHAPDTAANDANKVVDTYTGSTTELKTTVSSTMANIGTTWLPGLTKIAQHLNKFVSDIQKHHPEIIKFLSIFLPAALGVGVLALAFLGLGLALTVAAVPTLILMAAFAGVIAVAIIIALVVMNAHTVFDKLHPVLTKVGNALKPIGDAFTNAKKAMDPILKVVDDIGKALTPLSTKFLDFKQVNTDIKPVLDGVKSILEAIGTVLGVVIVVAIGIIVGVITGLMVVFKVVFATIGWVIVDFQTIFSGIVGIIGGVIMFVWGIIEMFMGHWDEGWKHIKDGWDALWRGILALIIGILSLVIHLVIGFVMLVLGFIGGFVAGIVTFFDSLLEKVTGNKGVITNFVHGILDWFHWVFTEGPKKIKELADAVLKHIVTMAEDVKTHIEDFVNNIKDGFHNGIAKVETAITEIVTTVTGKITDLGSTLFDSGKHMIEMLANGITGAAGKVTDSVSGVATNIKNFLGWKSPTKEGPGSDADQWTPNLMTMMVKGIVDHTPNVGDAALGVASAIHGGFSSPMTRSLGAAAGSGGSGYVANFYLDSKLVAKASMDTMTGQMQMTGMGRLAR